MTEFSGSQFGCLQCHCHVLREEIGDEGIKKKIKMGQLKFSGRLSKQAGCFGTHCILNRTVLDNLIYMIKRADWRSCCWLECFRLGRLLEHLNSCTRGFTSTAGQRGSTEATPAALPHPGWPQRLNQTPATIQNTMSHTLTLPSSHQSAHHYGVNASGGLKHIDT